MKKKIIKYTSRIVLGLFTLFGGLATWVAFHHSMDEYSCEAGQEDMNPVYGILITIASLILFCFVWYITRDRSTENPDPQKAHEELPEPYKSFADLDKYISEVAWIDIENEDMLAPTSGLYLFNCRGDNHTFFETHKLEKGEKLCKHYLDHHFDGWALVKPVSYHYVETSETMYDVLKENWTILDDSNLL